MSHRPQIPARSVWLPRTPRRRRFKTRTMSYRARIRQRAQPDAQSLARGRLLAVPRPPHLAHRKLHPARPGEQVGVPLAAAVLQRPYEEGARDAGGAGACGDDGGDPQLSERAGVAGGCQVGEEGVPVRFSPALPDVKLILLYIQRG